MTGEREYYTVREAAQELDESPATVWRWIAAGKLPAFRVGLKAAVQPVPLEQVGLAKEHLMLQPLSEEQLHRRQAVVAESSNCGRK